ncbi:MAG: hypothetical protein QNJ54_34265 [Prochloraceae cyanobacterium]|nr:hypothetical protein [Prochloraceae cyanobacterium]
MSEDKSLEIQRMSSNISEILAAYCGLRELFLLTEYISQTTARITYNSEYVTDPRVLRDNKVRIRELEAVQEYIDRRCQVLGNYHENK